MRFLFISKRRDPFEIGARLIAALAFPAAHEATERRRAALGWCTDYMRQWLKLQPERKAELHAAYPLYCQMSLKDVKAALRTTFNRLDKRIIAGKMARGIFQEHIENQPVVLPTSMARHSLNELSKLVLAEAHQADPHNVETRIWGGSRPIIHLASGYDLAARLLPPELEGQYDMNNLAAHEALIAYGEWAESVVVAADKFGIKPDQLLRVRLK